MGYGLVDTGYSKKNQALQGMSQTAQSETQRNIANDNIKLLSILIVSTGRFFK